jgi:hypothetical protein
MTSAPHPIEAEELMAYLDGELSAGREAVAAGHLETCAECRKLVEELKGVSRKLAEWEVEGCKLEPVEGKVRRWPMWRKPVWAAGLAAAGVLVLFSLRLYQVSEVNFVKTRAPFHAFLVPPQPARTPQAAPADYGTRLKATFLDGPMIARTAQLSLITTDFPHVRERLETILKTRRGYMGQLGIGSPTGAGRTLEAALRVPSNELGGAMADLRKLGRVEAESQNGEEVTQQYVDLEARLANARNAEQRLSAVLRQRTGKMQDVLDVEKEITRVRGEIEQMEAGRKALSRRVEFATINVRITEEYKARLQGPDSVGTRLGNAAVAGYRHAADGALGFGEWVLEYGLSILLWGALLFWPARLMWRRMKAFAPRQLPGERGAYSTSDTRP